MTIEGRVWLPPDTESAVELLKKASAYHYRESKADHRGDEHVILHRLKFEQCADAEQLVLHHCKNLQHPYE